MVVGPKGYGDITAKEALDFADPMLRLNLDLRLVQYIGHIHPSVTIGDSEGDKCWSQREHANWRRNVWIA